jgi:hypothetical protein
MTCYCMATGNQSLLVHFVVCHLITPLQLVSCTQDNLVHMVCILKPSIVVMYKMRGLVVAKVDLIANEYSIAFEAGEAVDHRIRAMISRGL